MAETNAPRSITGSNIAPEIMNGGQLVSEVHQLRARIAALEAELAAARKDAERYRWLRRNQSENPELSEVLITNKSRLRISYASLDLDDVIDAALGKGEVAAHD